MKKVFAASIRLSFCLGLLISNIAGATGYTLTVSPQGSGTVTKNPANSSYPAGVTVIVTATPEAGWYFANWSGDATGNVNPLNVTMNANLAITGNFLPLPTYALTLATNGSGAIALSPAGGSYLSNTIVTATATPLPGWVFAGWTGSTNSTSNPVSLTLNTNQTLTGTFAQVPAFDVQPASVTSEPASTVSFTPHVVGTLPLTYQWFFNGNRLTAMTNLSLVITNAKMSQVGNYWLVATNAVGSATSSVVSLTLTNFSAATNVVTAANEASLRAAIALGGWVGLGFNGTIVLTDTITITNEVILDGKYAMATISGGNLVRLFYVAPGGHLSATNLTLADGSCLISDIAQGTNADAGAIYNDGGTVNLTTCTLTNNQVQAVICGGIARGGAIFNHGGTVSLYQSKFLNNTAIGGGPNAAALATIAKGLGGAIFNTNGWITANECSFNSNVCTSVCEYDGTGLAAGGAVYQASGTLLLTNNQFSINQALGGAGAGSLTLPSGPGSSAYGGALAVEGGALAIDLCQFYLNTVKGGAAGYHGRTGPAAGGAVYSAATWSADYSSFYGNQASAGNMAYASSGSDAFAGAIYNLGSAALNHCSIYANYVQGGSAFSGTRPDINGGHSLGGGIFNASFMAATNCTFALNAVNGGVVSGMGALGYSGLSGNGFGGGIFNNTNAAFNGWNLTIASNVCVSPASTGSTNGVAAGSQVANTNGTLRLYNSLLAGTNSNAYGPITDAGYNICSDGTAQLLGGTSYNYTNPKLAALANNGGPTLCMALLPDSPAIDYGGSANLPDTDQRGFVRPFGDGPDMGAYEYGSYQPNAPLTLHLTATGDSVQLTFTALATNIYRLQGSTNLINWDELNTNGPFASATNLSQTISQQGLGRRFFRLLVQ